MRSLKFFYESSSDEWTEKQRAMVTRLVEVGLWAEQNEPAILSGLGLGMTGVGVSRISAFERALDSYRVLIAKK